MSERLRVNRILCPTDFSGPSAMALRHAVSLGRWFDAEIVVLNVLPFRGSELPYFSALATLDSPVGEQAATELAQFVEPVLHEPVTIEPKLREGEPWREIVAEVKALPADLVVMGTHGRSGFEHLLLGSVAEKVLRRAGCPVLTVARAPRPTAKRHTFRRILCGFDFTEDSAQALRFALALAEEGEGQLTLLHVLERLPVGSAPGLGGPLVPGGRDPLRRDLEAAAHERLRGAVPDESRDFCKIEEQVAVGQPYYEILRVAAEQRADLIVLGARARGLLRDRFLGSTTSYVVREAACPVLTIRAQTGRPHTLESGSLAPGTETPDPPVVGS